MTPEEFGALGEAAQRAVVAAVLVRNGMEELHAEGAFDDHQAPVLNRRVRQEMLQAYTSAQTGGRAHEDYLRELAEDGSDGAGGDFRLRCLTGAAARAVRAFAEDAGLDDQTADALVGAAQAAVCDREEVRAMQSPLGVLLLLSCISAWEPPTLSDEYRQRVGLV